MVHGRPRTGGLGEAGMERGASGGLAHCHCGRRISRGAATVVVPRLPSNRWAARVLEYVRSHGSECIRRLSAVLAQVLAYARCAMA